MIFEYIRKLVCPFDQIETFVPKKGEILDVGCGHGIFSKILIETSSQRKVLGIDPSVEKIKQAIRINGHIKNLKFLKSEIEKINNQKFDCICIIDVLYLIPPFKKIKILKKAKSLLKKNGEIIICEVSTEPAWMYNLIKIEEKIMVKILKYTKTLFDNFSFFSKNEYRLTLKQTGFKVISSKILTSKIGYPKHFLLVATPNGKH